MTKLQKILNDNDMSQSQLIELIRLKTGRVIGKDRISKICSGKLVNYSVATADLIAKSMGIPMDTFVETDKLNQDDQEQ